MIYIQVMQKSRAKVDSYLHLHHRNVREASIGLVAPKVRKDLNFSEDFLATSKATYRKSISSHRGVGGLHNSRYLAGDDLTIADISAYVEMGQLTKYVYQRL